MAVVDIIPAIYGFNLNLTLSIGSKEVVDIMAELVFPKCSFLFDVPFLAVVFYLL